MPCNENNRSVIKTNVYKDNIEEFDECCLPSNNLEWKVFSLLEITRVHNKFVYDLKKNSVE